MYKCLWDVWGNGWGSSLQKGVHLDQVKTEFLSYIKKKKNWKVKVKAYPIYNESRQRKSRITTFFAITLTGISDKNNDTIYMKVIGNFDKILTKQEKKMVILEQLNQK